MNTIIKILVSTILIGCQEHPKSDLELEVSQFLEAEIYQSVYSIKGTIKQLENNEEYSFTQEDLQRNPLISKFSQIETLINEREFQDAYFELTSNKIPMTPNKFLNFKLYKKLQYYYRDIVMNTDVKYVNDWSVTPLSYNVRDTIKYNSSNYGYIENNADRKIDTSYTRKLKVTVNGKNHQIDYEELPFISLPTNKKGINTTSLSYVFTNVITGLEMSKTVLAEYYVK